MLIRRLIALVAAGVVAAALPVAAAGAKSHSMTPSAHSHKSKKGKKGKKKTSHKKHKNRGPSPLY